jgi:hypothetical protein
MNNSNAILFVKTVAVLSIQTNANSLLQYKHTGVCMPSCRLQVQTENGKEECATLLDLWLHIQNLNFVLNSPFQSNLLNLSLFASVPDRFELNIINLLLLYACFLLAGDLLLSFYFTGILLLGEILSRISFKCLDVNTITTLSDFFISRLVSLML